MGGTIESHRDWQSYWRLRPFDGDALAQVGRTINGRPVSNDQVELIVNAVLEGLSLHQNDHLLDLCCGNGLITKELSKLCEWVTGVDYSHELIRTAKAHYS